MYVETSGSAFATKLIGYLEQTDYRIAKTEAERLAIFRLRYESYVSENAILENDSGLFRDAYDDMENCWNFGIYIGDTLAGAVRCHLISAKNPQGPGYDFFPDIVRPRINDGQVFVDATRFVVNRSLSKTYPELPYVTLRAACMAYEFFEADYCLASVRKEHQAFYRRLFRAELLCDPRPYPPLTVQLSLMQMSAANIRDRVQRRYPIFVSSDAERRRLFDGVTVPPVTDQRGEDAVVEASLR